MVKVGNFARGGLGGAISLFGAYLLWGVDPAVQITNPIKMEPKWQTRRNKCWSKFCQNKSSKLWRRGKLIHAIGAFLFQLKLKITSNYVGVSILCPGQRESKNIWFTVGRERAKARRIEARWESALHNGTQENRRRKEGRGGQQWVLASLPLQAQSSQS